MLSAVLMVQSNSKYISNSCTRSQLLCPVSRVKQPKRIALCSRGVVPARGSPCLFSMPVHACTITRCWHTSIQSHVPGSSAEGIFVGRQKATEWKRFLTSWWCGLVLRGKCMACSSELRNLQSIQWFKLSNLYEIVLQLLNCTTEDYDGKRQA